MLNDVDLGIEDRLKSHAFAVSYFREVKAANALIMSDKDERIAELEAAMRDLRLTARVLLQNAEGCAYNHHAEDTHQFGEPGWIADSRKTIEAAEKLLST